MGLGVLPSLGVYNFVCANTSLNKFNNSAAESLLLHFLTLNIFAPLVHSRTTRKAERRRYCRFRGVRSFHDIVGAECHLVPCLCDRCVGTTLGSSVCFGPLKFICPSSGVTVHIRGRLVLNGRVVVTPICRRGTENHCICLPRRVGFVGFVPSKAVFRRVLTGKIRCISITLGRMPLFVQDNGYVPITRMTRYMGSVSARGLGVLKCRNDDCALCRSSKVRGSCGGGRGCEILAGWNGGRVRCIQVVAFTLK